MKPLRLCLWSGPRNISTALMYSFAQRSDTRVIDEPLYGYYLRRSGVEHPGRERILAAMENDGEAVVRDVILGPTDRPVLFFKLMAHHLAGLDRSFLEHTTHVMLTRDPREMLPSLRHQIPAPRLEDTGLEFQSQLFEELSQRGQEPPVVDSRLLLLDPETVLRQLCERLGLEFEESMLGWPMGPRPEDGIWAPHWYENVHRSTGFQPYRPKTAPLPPKLEPLLAECKPHYDRLFRHALGAGLS